LRMQINTDIMEKYMGAPQQMKTRITTWSGNPTTG
jgi:hypothetical protein